jgi:hypothetical protein
MLVEFVHGGHDAILEFLFGCDTNVAQHGAGELGKEPLDEIDLAPEERLPRLIV